MTDPTEDPTEPEGTEPEVEIPLSPDALRVLRHTNRAPLAPPAGPPAAEVPAAEAPEPFDDPLPAPRGGRTPSRAAVDESAAEVPVEMSSPVVPEPEPEPGPDPEPEPLPVEPEADAEPALDFEPVPDPEPPTPAAEPEASQDLEPVIEGTVESWGPTSAEPTSAPLAADEEATTADEVMAEPVSETVSAHASEEPSVPVAPSPPDARASRPAASEPNPYAAVLLTDTPAPSGRMRRPASLRRVVRDQGAAVAPAVPVAPPPVQPPPVEPTLVVPTAVESPPVVPPPIGPVAAPAPTFTPRDIATAWSAPAPQDAFTRQEAYSPLVGASELDEQPSMGERAGALSQQLSTLASERPEVLVGAAFLGGLILATILKRYGRG